MNEPIGVHSYPQGDTPSLVCGGVNTQSNSGPPNTLGIRSVEVNSGGGVNTPKTAPKGGSGLNTVQMRTSPAENVTNVAILVPN